MKVEVIIALITLFGSPVAVSWSLIRRQCEISLPQKTTTLKCKLLRCYELSVRKGSWKLDTSPWGFQRLHLSIEGNPPWFGFAIFAMADPFRRFYFEDYLQTVLVSDATKTFYKWLFNKKTKISHNYAINYKVLSNVFEWAADLGGEVAMRASEYEPFIDEKDKWISDKYFTQQRLAGVNPMSLRRVTFHGDSKAEQIGLDWNKVFKENLNPVFNWEAAVKKALGGNISISKAIKQGRIYALRYELCDDLPIEHDYTEDDNSRTMWKTLSPIALFVSVKNTTTLRNDLFAVAIQMDRTKDSAVFTPEDEGNWMMAKLNVQVTDLGYGQIVEHLAKVHFLMEPFCVILQRTLSSRHPLYQILQYHCRDVTVPNTIGAPALVGEGKYMDMLFAFGSEGTERLLKDAYSLSTWQVTDFRNELKKRGVDDKDLLPYFPYRDDGEKILEVIENIVKDYVDLYYYDDRDVTKDQEFGNFLEELSIGKIKGLPPKINTKEELCDIVTRIISQLSIQHATVNYPLSDYAEYIPNLPTKLYNDTRLKEGEFSILRLPNNKTSAIQIGFSNSLALYRFDTLFDYGNNLEDIKATKLINKYYGRLMNEVQPKMQEVNKERKKRGDLTYPYLIPRWIPNGIQT